MQSDKGSTDDKFKDGPAVPSTDGSAVVELGECRELGTKRGLSSRHAQFIAFGGAIGTGLFVGSGKTLAHGGPAVLVASYVIMSALIYLVLTAVAEMATYLPLPGGTMNYYGGRYVSRSLGFVMGWLYFYSFAIFIPFGLTSLCSGHRLLASGRPQRGLDHHHAHTCGGPELLARQDLRRDGVLVCRPQGRHHRRPNPHACLSRHTCIKKFLQRLNSCLRREQLEG